MDERTRTTVPSGASVWERFRRPAGLVDGTRWLFFLTTLLSWVIVLPGVFAKANATTLVLGSGSCVVLVGSWTYQYLSKAPPLWLDIGYFGAVAAFALSCPVPSMAFSFGFCGLWFRAMYGSNRRVWLYCVGTAVGMVTSILLWKTIPGHRPTAAAAVFGSAPVMFLVVAAFRHLAVNLFAREESQRRDTALAYLGSQLLGITDREEIYRCARDSVATFCATTTGLQVLVGFQDSRTDSIQIMDHAGPFSANALEWPLATSLVEATARQPTMLQNSAELAAASGFDGQWFALPLPDEPTGWMLLGSPTKITGDIMVAFSNLINQVALALRNSEAHHNLDTQANTDSLTGLSNRGAFTLAVDRAFIANPDRLALMFVDLDDFKTVNDGLGHAAGDELLRHVATRMRAAVCGGDLCARIGGDEFAVLLPEIGKAGTDDPAALIAQRLIDLISAPVSLSGTIVQIGASIGLAHVSPDITPALLLQRADIAMYAAKARGKNRFQVFEAGLLQSEEQPRRMATLADPPAR